MKHLGVNIFCYNKIVVICKEYLIVTYELQPNPYFQKLLEHFGEKHSFYLERLHRCSDLKMHGFHWATPLICCKMLDVFSTVNVYYRQLDLMLQNG